MIFQKLIDKERLTQEIRQSSIVTALNYINSAGINCDVQFKGPLSDLDVVTLNKIVAKHIPVPLPITNIQAVAFVNEKLTPSGRPQVSVYEPEGSAATIVSYNFCDKTTWWQTAMLVTMETLTASVTVGITSTTVFNTAHTFIVDMTHGKCYDEDTATTADPSLIPKIYVDDVLQMTGYTIDYKAGIITFSASTAGVIKASYKYAINSYFILKPKAGQVLSIKDAQVQFSVDNFVNSPVVFEAWIDHPIYGKIAIPSTRIKYKNEKDLIMACNGGQELIRGWGNYALDTIVLMFNYARPKPIKSSAKLEIRIYIQDHVELKGTLANATFYVTVENE